ncbi:MAG TPA: argininosuccinate synthase [Syntrophorhabdaceae bacterium]|jgi:argininosuccinate synthase|nr:argininosuccinate synthase [Syntrophorhabdaceae bacterium]MDI9562180.1 argininosuccinate synthase [Pseudomonadota bacterium]MBP8698720.1 argininosuccinate synthase [Syntrophorhabdaceae bacterium]MBV6506554.1 Argininosuccinate synthase [Syntrophorhabdaceae bacterium]HNQ63479.1 argininosuccinate synthase [Syntrophorhabdaceae bacterium]
MKNIKKVVLAYSGGLDTSIIVKWLKETYNCEVIAFAADVGQEEELTGLEEKAIKTGASKIYIEDLKEEFARDFVFFAIKSNAIYEGNYLLGTSIARPLIAKRQVEIARIEGADAVSHGSTGKGNDQVRFELTYYALEPNIKVIAPWREWDFSSREELIDYAQKHNIDVPVSKEKPYSMDRNLMHISYEGGILEDTWNEPDENMFLTTISPERAPDKSSYIEISFSDGIPYAIDGKEMTPYNIIKHLNKIGGENGIGRVDIVENRFVGMKSRGVYETPGCTILHVAHRAMESITMDREVMHLRDSLIPKVSELIYYGFWYSPEMEVLKAFTNEAQAGVSGTVRLKLYKGNCIVVGRKSEKSLYMKDFATFDKDDVYQQKDAGGFIRLNALRLRIRALMNQ